MVTARELIGKLPPYKDQWIVIKDNQNVKDIILEVCDAHSEFAPFYDRIALYFDADSTEQICDNIYNFLKKNIRYREESEDDQTSAVPTGLLVRGYGDCKHYSGLAAGILDSLKRSGKKIDWCYRFASYRLLDSTPHHVFVVVNDYGFERWIDPTPGSMENEPSWYVDKKVKVSEMALTRNIGGFENSDLFTELEWEETIPGTIGRSSVTLTPVTNIDNINFDGTGRTATVFNPNLGLSQYRDYGGDRTINTQQLADQINQAIAAGPSPGHTVAPDFIQFIYDRSVRSWNFYYPWGAEPGFTAENLLPAGYPILILTDDGRLTLSNDVAIDDFANAEIHLLTAWAQSLIAQYDPSPYVVTPQHLKEFSQMKQGNTAVRNLFTEARGSSFVNEIGKWLEDSVNFVKDGVFKIVGSIPRNAFLGLVGLNVFNFAGNMWEKIQAGEWENMAKKWESLGGNPEKLRGTIEDGKDKKPILAKDERGNAIGEVATGTAAFLAAAAPIIAAMLAFLKDPDGKIKNVLQATKGFLQTQYPDADWSMYDFLDTDVPGMKPIEWMVDPIDNENLGGGNNDLPGDNNLGSKIKNYILSNPMIAAGAAGAIAYLLTNGKGKKPNYILPLIAAGGIYFFIKKSSGQSLLPLSTEAKRAALLNFASGYNATDHEKQIYQQMTPAEINDVYELFFTYNGRGADVPAGRLRDSLQAISTKYNIFT